MTADAANCIICAIGLLYEQPFTVDYGLHWGIITMKKSLAVI